MRLICLLFVASGCALFPGDPTEPAVEDTSSSTEPVTTPVVEACPMVFLSPNDEIDPVVEIDASLALNTICSDTWLALRTELGEIVDLQVCEDEDCFEGNLARLTFVTRTGGMFDDAEDIAVVEGDVLLGQFPARAEKPDLVRFMCHDLDRTMCTCTPWP